MKWKRLKESIVFWVTIVGLPLTIAGYFAGVDSTQLQIQTLKKANEANDNIKLVLQKDFGVPSDVTAQGVKVSVEYLLKAEAQAHADLIKLEAKKREDYDYSLSIEKARKSLALDQYSAARNHLAYALMLRPADKTVGSLVTKLGDLTGLPLEVRDTEIRLSSAESGPRIKAVGDLRLRLNKAVKSGDEVSVYFSAFNRNDNDMTVRFSDNKTYGLDNTGNVKAKLETIRSTNDIEENPGREFLVSANGKGNFILRFKRQSLKDAKSFQMLKVVGSFDVNGGRTNISLPFEQLFFEGRLPSKFCKENANASLELLNTRVENNRFVADLVMTNMDQLRGFEFMNADQSSFEDNNGLTSEKPRFTVAGESSDYFPGNYRKFKPGQEKNFSVEFKSPDGTTFDGAKELIIVGSFHGQQHLFRFSLN